MGILTPSQTKQTEEDKARQDLKNYWVLHGQAYDFTGFVKSHPAGARAILLGKGRDCTVLFESYHTHMPSSKILDKYRVDSPALKSVLGSGDRSGQIFTFEEGGFYRTLKERTREYFKKGGYTHTKASAWNTFFFFLNIILSFYFTFAAFVQGSLIAAVLHGLARALIIIGPTHATSHYAMFTNVRLNQLCYRLSMAMSGSTPIQWSIKHIISHHIETNLTPTDEDTMYPIKRILHELPRLWFHAWQHIYMWVFYPFTTFFWTLSNIIKLTLGYKRGILREGQVDIENMTTEDWAETTITLIWHTFHRMVLPFLCLPWPHALAVFLLAEISGSAWFALQFAVSHEVEECTEDKQALMLGKSKIDWGAYQVISSHNYDVDSLWALHLSGGLNLQIEHHLFPSIHYEHYPALSQIVQQTCKEFGLPYIRSPSMWGALKKHFDHMKKMGAPTAAVPTN